MDQEREVVLEVEDIVKQFPGVLANDHVNLKLHRGEILALLGENGAGKSTLMNVIYGLYHQDEGVARIKGREVHFASPREAIRSGIGMVHQHFQLVNVMTVAENVVLGEEADVAYKGTGRPLLELVMRWLPSLVMFVVCVILGVALGELKYLLGGAAVGVVAGVAVAVPPLARGLWSIGWRVGLVFAALWLATQFEMITEVGLTDIALRQKIETVSEDVQAFDDYAVKVTVEKKERIEFDWRHESRDADEAGTGINGVLASARLVLNEYRDQGVPGSLIDAIDDVPPVAKALGVALLLFLFGAHSIRSWRGVSISPTKLARGDLAAIGGLALLYAVAAWLSLDHVDTTPRAGLTALAALGLGYAVWRTVRHREQLEQDEAAATSPLDSVLDAFLVILQNIAQIRNPRAAAQRVHELSQQYGLEVDPDAVIEKLPVGTQQRVEIVKALYREADILILDEPTSVLTPQESRELFKIMRELAAQGVSIIFITHKLKEVFEVATNIVVMRGGRVVGTTTPDQATEASLAAMMVGREVILQVEKDEAHPAKPVLEVHDLNAYNDRGAKALTDVSFTVCAGEVLGIAGVQGNGQTELVEVLTGLREASGGSVRLLGVELQPDVQPEGNIWARAAAFVIDMLIVGALSSFFGYFVSYFGETTFDDMPRLSHVIIGLAVAITIDVLYFLGSWEASGGTIGMALFSLQLADRDDKKPHFPRLFERYLIFLALRLPLGIPALISFVMAYRDERRRNWFDDLLHLRVIRRERITPRRVKDAGTSHVPEDRQRRGMVMSYSVADNLVLNDYYERPYAKSPTASELPGTVLSYVLVFALVVGGLTALALQIWDNSLWKSVLDLYNVPDEFRTYSIDTGLPGDQADALRWPFIISVLSLLLAELVFGAVAYIVTSRVMAWDLISRGACQVRKGLSLVLSLLTGGSVAVMTYKEKEEAKTGGLLRDQDAVGRHADSLIEMFDIRTPSAEVSGSTLSGGNQQKMIVAREFSRRPRLLIAAQPTRGIDVGSIEFVHKRIIEQRDEGAAVLLVSAELDEIMGLSDRIAVIYKGEIIDTLPAKDAVREHLGLLMAGIKNGPPEQGEAGSAPAGA